MLCKWVLIMVAVGHQNSLRRICRGLVATLPVNSIWVQVGSTSLELIVVPGWLSSLSWLVGVASAMFIASNLIPTLISVHDPSVITKPWHGYLFVVAICVFCFLVNAYFAKVPTAGRGLCVLLHHPCIRRHCDRNLYVLEANRTIDTPLCVRAGLIMCQW